MSDLMRPIPFGKMMEWMMEEYRTKDAIFGVHKEKFYCNKSGKYIEMFGEKIASPVGPAAGPNSQLAQNIVAAYLAGSRFVELKTVQIMDGEELRACVAKPCINAEDECYNVEWSTEMTVPEAFDEYVKAYVALHVMAKELGISDTRDFLFNASVGYDLDGIKSPKIDAYIEGMKDATGTAVWKECTEYLNANADRFTRFKKEDIAAISPQVCNSITLSTLHGCPPDEIERIARYLLEVKGVHTFIKCNPTLLGYETARKLLDDMGYDYISFDDHHFNNDLQYGDAIAMLKRLMALAKEKSLAFGVKITNTFPVQNVADTLPGEEMYMSGRSLYPLSLTAAYRLSKDFDGQLPISFSGGADAFNIVKLLETGIQPITIATTVLKPGGYERILQLVQDLEPHLKGAFTGMDMAKLADLAENVTKDPHHLKELRVYGSRKTDSNLPLYDCYKAPCKDGGCPIEQQIPEYLHLVNTRKYKEAFDVIAIDNTCPSILGTICNHSCQSKCTRMDYEEPLHIRQAKGIAADSAQLEFIQNMKASALKTDKKVVVIGAGPAGIAAALYLRRNGMHVTVLEKTDKPYGIIAHVIPEFRIAKEKIERDYQMAVEYGVEFQFGVHEDYDVASLKKDYDYVVLATGAWGRGICRVKEGEELFRDALEFLAASKANDCKVELGKRVAVIGGGDVAMDCARAAKRAPGVEEVVIVYRRTRQQMPAEHEEIIDALNDGVVLMELTAPIAYNGSMFTCEKMKLGEYDASGRRSVKGTGEFVELPFDTVITAVGAKVDTGLFEKNGIAMDQWNCPQLNENNETAIEHVYIAGDCKKGPSTIVKAVADSKAIAKDILRKEGLDHDFVRVNVSTLECELMRRKGILLEPTQAEGDCQRCLACDQVCELCCDVCPNRANVKILVSDTPFRQKEQIVHIDGMCNECGNCGVFCPHTGNPYKDKVTVFWTEEDFVDSTNKGFLPIGEQRYKVRREDGQIVEHRVGDGTISPEMAAILAALEKDYAFYLDALQTLVN